MRRLHNRQISDVDVILRSHVANSRRRPHQNRLDQAKPACFHCTSKRGFVTRVGNRGDDRRQLLCRLYHEESLRRALAIQEKTLGTENLSLGGTLDALGGLFSAQERWAEAEVVFRASLSLREAAYSPLHAEVAPALDNLAGVLFQQKRYADAEPLYARSMFIWSAALGEEHPLVAEACDALARTLAFQSKHEAAELSFRRGLDIREGHTIRSLNNTALMAVAQKKPKDAEPFYKVALALLDRPRERPADADLTAQTLSNYADVLNETGRKLEASKLEARAKKLESDNLAKSSK